MRQDQRKKKNKNKRNKNLKERRNWKPSGRC